MESELQGKHAVLDLYIFCVYLLHAFLGHFKINQIIVPLMFL